MHALPLLARTGGGLSLGTNAYSGLVNVAAVSGRTNMVRVKPGHLDHSVLILTMIGTTCTDRMPPTNPTLFDKAPVELALVRTWIENGAPSN